MAGFWKLVCTKLEPPFRLAIGLKNTLGPFTAENEARRAEQKEELPLFVGKINK